MARTAAAEASAWLEETRAWFEGELERSLPPARPGAEQLHQALRHALLGGGKRLRPALVRLWCQALGGDDQRALPPALAVECIHGYSLVHDDLPSMDDDQLRRGRPTCHVVYGEALAILAGDALQALAFEFLARARPEQVPDLVATLARAAGAEGMVGGQALDLAAARSAELLGGPLEAARATHALKTAALIGAAAELGAIAAGADGGVRAEVRAWGLALGRCFQAVDDCLDVTGDARTLGKTPGKDADLERNTLVAARGLAGARAEAEAWAAEARSAARKLGFGPGTLPHELVERVLERRS